MGYSNLYCWYTAIKDLCLQNDGFCVCTQYMYISHIRNEPYSWRLGVSLYEISEAEGGGASMLQYSHPDPKYIHFTTRSLREIIPCMD